MRILTKAQAEFTRLVLQKIDRRSKVIKKHQKKLDEDLHRKKVWLERDGFDILSLIDGRHEEPEE